MSISEMRRSSALTASGRLEGRPGLGGGSSLSVPVPSVPSSTEARFVRLCEWFAKMTNEQWLFYEQMAWHTCAPLANLCDPRRHVGVFRL